MWAAHAGSSWAVSIYAWRLCARSAVVAWLVFHAVYCHAMILMSAVWNGACKSSVLESGGPGASWVQVYAGGCIAPTTCVCGVSLHVAWLSGAMPESLCMSQDQCVCPTIYCAPLLGSLVLSTLGSTMGNSPVGSCILLLRWQAPGFYTTTLLSVP